MTARLHVLNWSAWENLPHGQNVKLKSVRSAQGTPCPCPGLMAAGTRKPTHPLPEAGLSLDSLRSSPLLFYKRPSLQTPTEGTPGRRSAVILDGMNLLLLAYTPRLPITGFSCSEQTMPGLRNTDSRLRRALPRPARPSLALFPRPWLEEPSTARPGPAALEHFLGLLRTGPQLGPRSRCTGFPEEPAVRWPVSVLPDTGWSDSWLRSTRAKTKDASDEWPSASKLLEDRHHVVVRLPFASEFSTQGSELLPGVYRHLSRLRTATQMTSPCPQTPRIPFCTGSRQEQASQVPSVRTAEEQTQRGKSECQAPSISFVRFEQVHR